MEGRIIMKKISKREKQSFSAWKNEARMTVIMQSY